VRKKARREQTVPFLNQHSQGRRKKKGRAKGVGKKEAQGKRNGIDAIWVAYRGGAGWGGENEITGGQFDPKPDQHNTMGAGFISCSPTGAGKERAGREKR